MININVTHEISPIVPKIANATEQVTYILTQQVVKDSNFYVPVDTHALEGSALIHSRFKEGLAIWRTPYAKRLYHNPQFKFSLDVNPNARGLWFEAAKATRLGSWERVSEKAMGRFM